MMHRTLFVSAAKGVLGLTVAAGLVIGSAGVPQAESSEPYDGRLAFTVLRGDKPIGRHEITFREVGDETHVDIDIALAVKIGFLTVFRYEHKNREVWKGDALVSVATDTNDDGTPFEVRAERDSNGLHVKTLDEEHVLPVPVIPTSYWNPAILTNKRWLDTQRGILLDIEVEKVATEMVKLADGRDVEADRYKVSGDLNITVWYTPKGEWVKLSFPARGSEIEYVLTDGYTGTRVSLAE